MVMKLIHTSDWHLGKRLCSWERGDEQARFLEQLRELAAAEQPDVLVVAGDVFDGAAPGSETGKLFVDRLLDIQEAAPEMIAVVIAGNHDSYARLVVDEALWARHRVRVLGRPAEDAAGMANFSANLVEIPGKGIVAAVPFCAPRNFPSVPGAAAGADRQSAYFAGLRDAAEGASGGLPVVLAAHLAVGRETDFTGQDRGMVIGGEECVEPGTLGAGWDYVALGHIHCPQAVKGTSERMRYCGTPMPMDFDEEGHPHGADVVELASHGAAPMVRRAWFAPLRAVATLGGTEGWPFGELLAAIPGAGLAEGTYLRLRVALSRGELPGADWSDRARAVAEGAGLRFCRLAAVKPPPAEGAAPELTLDEVRELTDEQVAAILRTAKDLTDAEVELLRGVMAELHEAEGGR